MYKYAIPTFGVLIATLAACASADPSSPVQQSSLSKSDEQLECAGFLGLECPAGLVCYDVPDDDCDPEHGGADCPGFCTLPPPPQPKPEPGADTAEECGARRNLHCPDDHACVDIPKDGCDPDGWDVDCPGACITKGETLSLPGEPCGDGTGFVCVPGSNCVAPEYECFAWPCPGICKATL